MLDNFPVLSDFVKSCNSLWVMNFAQFKHQDELSYTSTQYVESPNHILPFIFDFLFSFVDYSGFEILLRKCKEIQIIN